MAQASSLVALREKMAEDANAAMREALPAKVLHLDRVAREVSAELDAAEICLPTAEELAEFARAVKAAEEGGDGGATAGKKRKVEDGGAKAAGGAEAPTAPVNAVLAKAIQTVTKEVTEGLELLTTIKTWVQLNIPRIEDGNNFGVAVQEEVVGELSRVEDAGFAVMDTTSKYHQTRARLCHKMVKHGLIEDYQQAVRECDQTQVETTKLTLIDMRNSLAVVHDMLSKNIDKITKPRTENSISMY